MKTHILAAVMGTWEQGVSIVRIVVGYMHSNLFNCAGYGLVRFPFFTGHRV